MNNTVHNCFVINDPNVIIFNNDGTQRSDLDDKAVRLYPDNRYLQREWVRAVSVVRQTSEGWQLERRVSKVQR